MKKKGFTLVELLAVIVILAIIALIATPIILNIIKSAKKNAAIDSAYGYIDAVEKSIISSEMLENKIIIPDNFILETGVNDQELSKIKVKGTRPYYVYMKFKSNKQIEFSKLCIDNYSFNYQNHKVKVSDNDYCSNFTDSKYNITINDVKNATILETSFSTSYNKYTIDVKPNNGSEYYDAICDGDTKVSYDNDKLVFSNISGDDNCNIRFTKYKDYLYNKGQNNGIVTKTSSSCNDKYDISYGTDGITFSFFDKVSNCTGWLSFESTESIDFSKYDIARLHFENLSMTGNSTVAVYTKSTNYAWTFESHDDYNLDLDVSKITDSRKIYIASTIRRENSPLFNPDYTDINKLQGTATGKITSFLLIGF